MTKQELVQKLRDLIAKGETKKNIEDKAGLSRNSLAGAMNNPDKMGKPMFEKLVKWVESFTPIKLPACSINKGALSPAVKDAIKEITESTSNNNRVVAYQSDPWIKLITDYCESQSMTPEELVAFHKAMIRPKKEDKSPATVTVTPKTESSSMSFMERRRKLKNGQ